ncbi:MAG: thioredoxin domain-containing protein [Anaerolineae bacterium]|nr:thioredoxin domain-containing protein [Anaerolineae bacterium]
MIPSPDSEAQPREDSIVQLEPPAEAPARLADQPVATISRVTFNYFLIAFVALLVGLVMGYFGYERVAANASAVVSANNEALIEQVAAAVVAALPQGEADPASARAEVDIAGNPTRGPEDAVITLIEFGDFRCGYCKRFHDETITPLMEQFPDQIRLVFRDYPVLGPDSLSAALAAECADDQGKFWDFHDALYTAPDQLTREAFLSYAETLEMDIPTFTACYDDQQHRSEIINDYVTGQNLGVSGTPTFFINGRILIGAQPLDTFVLAIEAELIELQNTETAS